LQFFEKSTGKYMKSYFPKPTSPSQPVKGIRLPRRKGPAGTEKLIKAYPTLNLSIMTL
jgi:hypothetical protein